MILCPSAPEETLPMGHRLDWHYGSVVLFRNYEWAWQYGDKQRGPLTLRWLEKKIRALPTALQNPTYTLNIMEPLREMTYERRTTGKRSRWVLIARGLGFA